MKAETVNYFVPASAKFTPNQMKQIKAAFIEKWGVGFDKATEEDILTEAESLGFIELPEGWKV